MVEVDVANGRSCGVSGGGARGRDRESAFTRYSSVTVVGTTTFMVLSDSMYEVRGLRVGVKNASSESDDGSPGEAAIGDGSSYNEELIGSRCNCSVEMSTDVRLSEGVREESRNEDCEYCHQ